MEKNIIELEDGAGGEKSNQIIGDIRKILNVKSKWTNTFDDGAVFELGDLRSHRPHPPRVRGTLSRVQEREIGKKLVFTTDAFIVDPLFFAGGDIGKIAMCGTINDLSVMGARPIGIALSLVIEEGFSERDLEKIIKSIQAISKQENVPIVTGDTKVTEKGKIDKLEITTSGVGLAQKIISNAGAKVGDVVITSGDLGEHAVALLASRFNYQTKIKSDCKPLTKEIQSVIDFLTSAKDPTRGGLAAILNELAEKSKAKIVLDEKNLPFKKETEAISNLLGIDKFSFPSEGRFVATVSSVDADKVIKILRKYNKEAKIIGEVVKGNGVWLKTKIGSVKKIDVPRGKLIPRIC